MKCSNLDCKRGIGLVAYQRGWFSKPRYCSQHCRDAFVADAPNLQQKRKSSLLKRFVFAFVAFVGLLVPATFTMAVLAAPPAGPEAPHLPGCDRNLADASASVAATHARIKSLSAVDRSEICSATRLYFLEMVKARAVTALCKSGAERERDLGRFDADVAHINDAIAAICFKATRTEFEFSTSDSGVWMPGSYVPLALPGTDFALASSVVGSPGLVAGGMK